MCSRYVKKCRFQANPEIKLNYQNGRYLVNPEIHKKYQKKILRKEKKIRLV